MLVLAPLLLAPPLQALLQPQAQSEIVVDVGHLRHVHWLAPHGEELRWATVASSGPSGGDLNRLARTAERSVVEVRRGKGELEARVEVPFRLLNGFTWTERPTWRVLELDGQTWVACVDVQHEQLHVFDLGAGTEVAARPGRALHDTRVVPGGAELLVAVAGGLDRVQLRPGDDVQVTAVRLATGLETVGAAAFVTGFADAVNTTVFDAWAAGWTGQGLALSRAMEASAIDERPASFGVAFSTRTPEKAELRIDAVRAGGRTWVALGDPSHASGVGRVLVAEVVEGIVAVRHAGRMDPDVIGDMSDQREWGQCVMFVPDADGDEIPDLAVAGPWTILNVHVDLISTGRWARLAAHGRGWGVSCGHWLDLSQDGKLLLAGGTIERAYPENLSYAGLATVLGARDLVERTKVHLAPEARSR